MLAIDFGGRFIDTATKLQNGEMIPFTNQNGEECTAGIDDNSNAKSITFKQVIFKSLFIYCKKTHLDYTV